MLVLSRKVGERIQIGADITVTVVRLADGAVRLGIEAPPHVSVVRRELMRDHQDAPQRTGLELAVKPA